MSAPDAARPGLTRSGRGAFAGISGSVIDIVRRTARHPAGLAAPQLDVLAGVLRSLSNGLRILELEVRVRQLEAELTTATVTAQATGILMALNTCDAERAAELLERGALRGGTCVEREAAVVVDRAERRPTAPVQLRPARGRR